MLTGKRLRQNLSTVKTVVVDEVHEMASSKRGSQLSVLLERLAELAGDFQRIGLSATVGSPEAVARLLVGTGRSFKIVQTDVERASDFQVVSPQPTRADYAMASHPGVRSPPGSADSLHPGDGAYQKVPHLRQHPAGG